MTTFCPAVSSNIVIFREAPWNAVRQNGKARQLSRDHEVPAARASASSTLPPPSSRGALRASDGASSRLPRSLSAAMVASRTRRAARLCRTALYWEQLVCWIQQGQPLSPQQLQPWMSSSALTRSAVKRGHACMRRIRGSHQNARMDDLAAQPKHLTPLVVEVHTKASFPICVIL